MQTVLAVLLLVAVLAGCGTGNSPAVVNGSGPAVIRDAYDGRLHYRWSCGSLRAAYVRLPIDKTYSSLPALIGAAAGAACDAASAQIGPGTSKERVRTLLGRPDQTARCWLYTWPPDRRSAQDGARFCFSGDRVGSVERAVHL